MLKELEKKQTVLKRQKTGTSKLSADSSKSKVRKNASQIGYSRAASFLVMSALLIMSASVFSLLVSDQIVSTAYAREESCNDGIDNDGDGYIDAADELDCINGEPVPLNENTIEMCNDHRDNDQDGKFDYKDDDCPRELICDDGIDNDGDGYPDTADELDCSPPAPEDGLPTQNGTDIICVMPGPPCDNGTPIQDDDDGIVCPDVYPPLPGCEDESNDNGDDGSAECAAAVVYPPGHPCNKSNHSDDGSAECAAAVVYPPVHPCNKSASPAMPTEAETDIQGSGMLEEARIDRSDKGQNSENIEETEDKREDEGNVEKSNDNDEDISFDSEEVS